MTKCCYHLPHEPESCQNDIANPESTVCLHHKVEYKHKNTLKHLTTKQMQERVLSWRSTKQEELL